jgi:hypothetical protein
MIITKHVLPRRTFLRGLGVTLALPLLDAMVPPLSALAKTAAKPVARLGFFYVPNGILMENWIPKGQGTRLELSPTLRSLTGFRDQTIVVTGLANHQASVGTGAGAHSKCQTVWLCGVPIKETEGADIGAGTTLDQIAAAKLGQDTPLRSLEVCTEPTHMGAVCEQGLSCVYQNTFSWRTPTSPLPMEHNPRVIFERLFGEGGSAAERLARARTDSSILDWVGGEIAQLRQKLGPADRRTVTEYVETVRDVERRIQRMERQSAESPFAVGTPPAGIPDSDDEHTKMLLNLQFLAYQSDVTRVVSYMIRREESQATYPQLGLADAHHNISHHGGNIEKMAMNAKINAYHVSLFAGLVEKMRATPDGDGSLLDHAILLYGAGMGDGNLHSPHELPVLLVGGGCGEIKGGRVLRYADKTPMMNLAVTLMDKVGVEVERIGDSTGRLADL